MYILFTSPICPYCKKVEAFLREHDLPFEARNVMEPVNRAELLDRGGMMQVPFFVDTSSGTAMYESEDIIAYLKKRV